jgi:3-phosphoshikimate 1-carboxyvinyltransferase
VSETLTLRRPPGPIHATLQPPGSKSLSNRTILLAAMATGSSRIDGCLDADDTRRMLDCLARLGISCRRTGEALADGLQIDGDPQLGRASRGSTLEVGTAGTVARFLTAALAAAVSPRWDAQIIDGSARMRERPMEGLLDALLQLGARMECLGQPGALPVRVLAGPGLAGGSIVLERPASSQFVSALLLAGCLARGSVRIELREGTPSRPYVDMTLALIETFGGSAGWVSDGAELVVEPRALQGVERYVVEPDASAASYLLALPAIWGGEVSIPPFGRALGRASLQGDAAFAEVLARFGAVVEQTNDRTCVRAGTKLRGVELDLADMPDVALTAAVVALFAEGPTRIDGVEILRHHESDRLAAGATELRKLGAQVIEREGGLEIHPPADGPKRGVVIDTYLDHRMAMAFSLVGDVVIADPRCVDKTFPDYFNVLAQLGMVVS